MDENSQVQEKEIGAQREDATRVPEEKVKNYQN